MEVVRVPIFLNKSLAGHSRVLLDFVAVKEAQELSEASVKEVRGRVCGRQITAFHLGKSRKWRLNSI